MPTLISVETALECISKHATLLGDSEHIPTHKALGRVLSEDIIAPLSLPLLDNPLWMAMRFV